MKNKNPIPVFFVPDLDAASGAFVVSPEFHSQRTAAAIIYTSKSAPAGFNKETVNPFFHARNETPPA